MALKDLKDRMREDGKQVDFENLEDTPQDVQTANPSETKTETKSEDVTKTAEVEDKTETSKAETKTEEKAEAKTETSKAEAKTEEKVDTALLDSFNKQFSTEYKDYDEIKNIITTKNDVSSLKTEIEQFKADNKFLESELEKKHEATDPKKIYGSLEGYTKHLIQEKGKTEGYNPSVVQRVINADIDKLNPLDLVMMDIENKAEELTGDKTTLMDLALKKVGLNVDEEKRRHEELRAKKLDDGEEDIKEFSRDNLRLTNAQLGELKLLASDVRKKFKELKKVEPEEFKDYKEFKQQRLVDIKKQREEVLTEWGDRADTLTKDFKIEFSYKDTNGNDDSYDFTDNSFNEKISEKVTEYIVSENIKPTNENINKIKTKLENDFWANKEKRELALKKIIEDAKMRKEEKVEDKYENTKPLNKETAPDNEEGEDQMGEWLKKRKSQTSIGSIYGLG